MLVVRVTLAPPLVVAPARSPSIITLRTTVGITLDTTRQATPAPQENIPLPEATAKTALQESTKMEPALGVTLAGKDIIAPGVLQVAPHVVKGSTVMPSPEPERPIAQNAPEDM